MNTGIFIGIGAGLASALLFLSVTTGNPAAVLLFYAAPLPLFIAGFGWGLVPAIVAAAVAIMTSALAAHLVFAGIYIVSCAAPCVWLVRLALLSRPLDENDPQSPREWYPAGRLVLWAAAFGTGVAVTAIITFGGTVEGYENTIETAFRALLGETGPEVPLNANLDMLIAFMKAYLAPASAGLWTLFTVLNMWLAVRIAAMSGRAIRPAIGMRDMAFPPQAAGAASAAIVGILIGGTIGLYAKALTGALAAAFILLGFAVVFGLTRGMAAQPFIIAALLFSALLIPLFVLLMALIGVADALFDLRTRLGAPPPSAPGGE